MIRNIIFDFGDIFINLNKKATVEALSELGVKEITDDMMHLYHQYEKGEISTQYFLDFFRNQFQISESNLRNAWNAVLLDFPEHRFNFLQDLADTNQFNLFLLSNTNDMHIEWVKESWGTQKYQDFKNCFHQFYLSFEIGYRKPNVDIYRFVLEKNHLKPKETLFIDDLKENTDAASTLGIQVWNLQPGQEDISELTKKVKLF